LDPVRLRQALERSAGVGIPSGVTGITSSERGLPLTRYSTSSAGVYRVSSGLAPAIEIPGIVEVLVDAITYIGTQF